VKKLFAVLVCVLVLAGCTPKLVDNARNAIAAASTFLKATQDQYTASCVANATQPVCVSIKAAIGANNALIDAVNIYCGGTPANGAASWDQGGACVPVPNAEAGLVSATNNLATVIGDLRTIVNAAPKPPKTSKDLRDYRKLDLDATRLEYSGR
jgi:hypothetical protein